MSAAVKSFLTEIKNIDFFELISKEMSLPNGIALSLDEKYIYVNNYLYIDLFYFFKCQF